MKLILDGWILNIITYMLFVAAWKLQDGSRAGQPIALSFTTPEDPQPISMSISPVIFARQLKQFDPLRAKLAVILAL